MNQLSKKLKSSKIFTLLINLRTNVGAFSTNQMDFGNFSTDVPDVTMLMTYSFSHSNDSLCLKFAENSLWF